MAPPTRHRVPFAATDIARLAHGHLGPDEHLAYAPDIPLEQRMGARLFHAHHLPTREPLLVVHDSTLVGMATSGFVITPERFCWKGPWSVPAQVEWERLRPDLLGTEGGRILLDGTEVPVAAPLARPLWGFLKEMAARPEIRDTTPYRAAGQTTSAVEPVDQIVRLAWEHLGAMHGFAYHPFIPGEMLTRGSEAVQLSPGEPVAAVYEDHVHETLRGFLLTPARLSWYPGDGSSANVIWQRLVRVQSQPTSVLVEGERLPWTLMLDARDDLPGAMARLLLAIARKAQAGELR